VSNDTTLLRVADTACGWCGHPVPEPVYLTLAANGCYRHRLLNDRKYSRRRVEVEGDLVRRAYCCMDHALAHARQAAGLETYHQGQDE
jgi:hypothetical protein